MKATIPRLSHHAPWTLMFAFAWGTVPAQAPQPAPEAVPCSFEFSTCVDELLFAITDSCVDPEYNPEYNPCVATSCQAGLCAVPVLAPNGIPCDDAWSGLAPHPNGVCTSSSLRTVAAYPNYNNCLSTSEFGPSPDCPPNHKCVCLQTGVCSPPQAGVCVCNDGCGNSCFDACVNGACTSNTFVRAEPGGLLFSSSTSLAWSPTSDASHWNTYRGTIPTTMLGGRLPGAVYDQVCFESADALADGPTVSTDGAVPPARTAFYYLVSAEADGCESALGQASSGAAIRDTGPCPTPP